MLTQQQTTQLHEDLDTGMSKLSTPLEALSNGTESHFSGGKLKFRFHNGEVLVLALKAKGTGKGATEGREAHLSAGT